MLSGMILVFDLMNIKLAYICLNIHLPRIPVSTHSCSVPFGGCSNSPKVQALAPPNGLHLAVQVINSARHL